MVQQILSVKPLLERQDILQKDVLAAICHHHPSLCQK